MFIKIFYKFLISLFCFFAAVSGIALLYSIMNLQTMDIIIVAFIFLVGIVVGLYLIKYYGKENTILLFEIDDKYITLTNAKQASIRIEKEECTAIIDKPNKVILEFSNKKYYIIKHFPFCQKLSDFSKINKENFINAVFL